MRKNKTSGLRRISLTVIILGAAFMVLPVIFPEDAAVIDKQLDRQDIQASEKEGSLLPVIFSNNPLSKYFKKLTKFYSLGKKNRAAMADKNSLYAFDDEDGYVMPSTASNGVFTLEEKGKTPDVFTSSNGTVIKPDADGYYYGDTYYKNGQYPGGESAKSIEAAIARYHAAAAAALGKKALYVKANDGSLKVKYVAQGDYDRYLKDGTMPEDEYEQASAGPLLASSERYDGARVVSQSSTSGTGTSSSFKSASRSAASDSGSSLGSLSDKFNEITENIAFNKTSSVEEAQASARQKQDDLEKQKLKLLASSSLFYRIYADPAFSKGRMVPNYDSQKYGSTPMVMDRIFAERFLSKFGITEGDYRSGLKTARLTASSRNPQNFAKNIMDVLGNETTFRVIGGQTGYSLHHTIGDLRDNNRDIFFDYIGIPENRVSHNMDDRKTFKEAFLQETGLKAVLTEAGVAPEKIAAIEAKYDKMDALRNDLKKELGNIVKTNPSLRDLKTSTTFILGRDKNGNAVVATPRAFMYVYAPPAPQWIEEKYNQDPSKRAYLPIDPDELVMHLKDNGNVNVVQTDDERRVLQDLGSPTTAVIDRATLSSYSPDSVETNMKILSQGIYKEMNRFASASQKAVLEDAKKKAEKVVSEANKAVGNKAKTGVNAAHTPKAAKTKTENTGTMQGRGPLRDLPSKNKGYIDPTKLFNPSWGINKKK